jgi:hypothetical protein
MRIQKHVRVNDAAALRTETPGGYLHFLPVIPTCETGSTRSVRRASGFVLTGNPEVGALANGNHVAAFRLQYRDR